MKSHSHGCTSSQDPPCSLRKAHPATSGRQALPIWSQLEPKDTKASSSHTVAIGKSGTRLPTSDQGERRPGHWMAEREAFLLSSRNTSLLPISRKQCPKRLSLLNSEHEERRMWPHPARGVLGSEEVT